MKSTLLVLASLVAMPAFAVEVKTMCTAEGQYGDEGRLVYELSGTHAEAEQSDEADFFKDLILNIMRAESESEQSTPYLENGTLVEEAQEEQSDILTFKVPEVEEGLWIDFNVTDRSVFKVRHSLEDKVLEFVGSCTHEELPEGEEPIDEGDGSQQQEQGDFGQGQQEQE